MTDRYENIRKALAMEPTPGPWQLSIETPTIIKQDLSSIGLSRGGVLIGSACGHESSGVYPTREQAIANARLIAACAPDTIRALLEERDALREALALLPDEIVMVEHNPYEGPLMFCCGQRVTLSWRHGLIPTHSKECWYARMRALRDHDQEDRNG